MFRPAAVLHPSWDPGFDTYICAISYDKQQLGTSSNTVAFRNITELCLEKGLRMLFWYKQRKPTEVVMTAPECSTVKHLPH